MHCGLTTPHGGGVSFPWPFGLWFMLVGGGIVGVTLRMAATGVLRIKSGRAPSGYRTLRRDENPSTFRRYVLFMVGFGGLWFLIGLVGLIASVFHLAGFQ